jgi:hypothetical protein
MEIWRDDRSSSPSWPLPRKDVRETAWYSGPQDGDQSSSGSESPKGWLDTSPVSYRYQQLQRQCPDDAADKICWRIDQGNGSGDASRSECITSERFGGRPQ